MVILNLQKPEDFFILLQYYTESSLPSKRLASNICAVCGQELVIASMDDIEEESPEKSYKLSCGHLYPFS